MFRRHYNKPKMSVIANLSALSGRSNSPTNSVHSDEHDYVGENFTEDATMASLNADNALSASSASTEYDQAEVGFGNAEDWIHKPIVKAELDFTMPFVHEMEKMFHNWSTLTKGEKDVLIESLFILVSVLSLDTLMTTQPTMRIGTQWKVIAGIFFQWFETLHTKQYFATQLFDFFKTLTTPALRGWMEDFFLYAEKMKSNKPTQECLSKKEVKEVSQDPAVVRQLNFGSQVMAIAEESRSFINIFLNPLYKTHEQGSSPKRGKSRSCYNCC